MSDTPRTDDAEHECVDEPVMKLGSVDADFARQLERELNAGNDRIKRLEDELSDAYSEIREHHSEVYGVFNYVVLQRAKEAKP